jgi:hypothetical protein
VSFSSGYASIFEPVLRRLLSLTLILLAWKGAPFIARSNHNTPPVPQKPSFYKVPVWVHNGAVGFQTNLTRENFQVLAGKSDLVISSFQSPQSPTLLFIVLDTVGEVTNINHMRVALIKELTALSPQYWVGLISAQEQVSVIQDPTPDRQLLQQRIEGFSQIGKAGLLESIQSVADFTTGILLRTNVRVAVIFITDSDIGNYRADYLNPPVNASDSRDLSRRFAGRALQEKISRMASSLARFQVPIFIVHIDPGRDPLNRAYHNGLKQFAEVAGGQLFLSKTTADIPIILHEAFHWACNFYVVGFEAPRGRGGLLKIQVSLPDEQLAQHTLLRLAYARRFFSP